MSKLNLMADYLINSLGFAKQEALSAAKKGRCSNFFRNDPDSVVNFLKELGLNKTQIKSIVSCCPNLLLADVDKTLQPKIKVLQDIGLSGSDLIKVLTSFKSLLSYSLKSILPSIEYLRNLLRSNELVVKAILRYSSLLHKSIPGKLAANVSYLEKMGISEKNLTTILTRHPRILLRGPQYLEKLVEMMENEYKMTRDSKMVYHGIIVLCTNSEAAIDKKFNIFRSFGWSEENIRMMFRTTPYVVGFSEARLQKVLDFFMIEIGCRIDYLARHPVLFNLSLDKRVKPRLKVIKYLLEKRLINVKPKLWYALSITESRFLKEFVLPHKDELDSSMIHVELLKNHVSPLLHEMTDLCALNISNLLEERRDKANKQ